MSTRVRLSRRQFVGGAIGGVAALVVPQGIWAPVPASAADLPNRTLWLRRPTDLLLLRVELFGLDLDPRGTTLVRTDAIAHLVVHFPPQHLHERTYQEVKGVLDTPVVPTGARLADESRLAFLVPSNFDSIPFTPEALLDWSRLDLAVVPAAVPPGSEPATTNLVLPSATQTALELPWQLVTSPVAGATFTHADAPVTRNGRTELWQTRLDGLRAPLRGVWVKDDGGANIAAGALDPSDLSPTPPDHPFDASLSPTVRAEIMLSTSDYGARGFTPEPVLVDRLALSALGADLRSAGNWDQARYTRSALMRWVNRTTLGRDLGVEVVRAGWLFPTGHPVSLVSVTERRLVAVDSDRDGQVDGAPLAPLVRREFLVVGDPVRRYGGASNATSFHPDAGRRFPFTEVRLVTEGTSDLDAADASSPYQPAGVSTDNVRPLTVHGVPITFQAVGIDRLGREVPFGFGGWFVSDTEAFDGTSSSVRALVSLQQQLAIEDPMRRAEVGGATVALADASAPDAGDTDTEVHHIVLGADLTMADRSDLRAAGQPVFFPAADVLWIRLRGSDVAADSSEIDLVPFSYDDDYVADGFEPDGSELKNPAHVFCAIAPQHLPPQSRSVGLSGDRTGMVITSGLQTAALSRTMGELAGQFEDAFEDAADVLKKAFDPREMLKARLAKLLGRFSLVDAIKAVAHKAGLATPEALTITAREERSDIGVPVRIITDLDWRPELQPIPAEGAHIFVPEGDASLVVQGHFETDLRNPSASINQLDGVLRNVKLTLFFDRGEAHLLDIPIRRLEFHDHTGSKRTVVVDIGQVEFHGVLRYIGQLADFLTRDGDGPWVEVGTGGISAGIETELPAVEVGLFAISNLSIWNRLDLPFDDRPVQFQMGVSRRDDPAQLTISMFGGGFYFQFRANADGLEELETSIMFGASATLDLGVASGAAGMFGGIILRLGYDDETEQDVAYMEGFFQAFGYFNVLMLIVMSAELYLGLGYDFESNKAYGRASFSFSISVVLFSFSVSVEVERRFGGEGDPTFEQLMAQDDWDDYCAAFA